MDFSSFVTTLTTSFIIFIVLVLIFTWLSRKPSNEVIYFPNRILKEFESSEGKRTKNPFAWIVEALKSTEKDVIQMAGVDTAVYFLFLNSALWILVLSGIVLLPVLLPVAGTDDSRVTDTNSNGTFNTLDKLAMGNITEESPRLWAFLIATYWVSFVTFYVLWNAYKHASDLRAAALGSVDLKPEQFTILVRDIPPPPEGQTQKEHVDSYFSTLHPETFYRSMAVTDHKEAYKIWKELEGYRKKLARAEAVFAKSKTVSKEEGTKPTKRIGFLGLIGKKVDTIDLCNEKIKELVPKLETEQKITIKEKQKRSALIFFNNKMAATSAAQTLHAQMIDTWIIMEAPEPRQLIWKNLTIKFYQRQVRQYIVYGIVFMAIVFYMIPIALISAFTTLSNLRKLLPFLKPIADQPEIKTILEAYLPQIVLILFLALLPTFLMFLSKAEGIPSESDVMMAASGKYFYFTVFNVFLGVTISGTLFSSIKTIVKHPKTIVSMLGSNLPANATFFITFVALKFFVGYGLELSRLIPLIVYHVKRKYLCKTEAEVKEAWAPGNFCFATRVPNDMLIVTIVLCYSVITPMIIPFGVGYFGLGWLVMRNQALNVYVPSYESNGRMWPHNHARILASLILYQVLMLGYFGIKKFYYTSFVIPLIMMSCIFSYVCDKRFYLAFCFTPLEIIRSQNNKEIPNMETIFEAYVPPCMNSDILDNTNQFEDGSHKVQQQDPMHDLGVALQSATV
ncbi:hyperosmolality-gated Ca2+ permeable channel 3.1-like [Tasmannia lanceolata]|uniref:hyperosmolality-gated Ca2+ permeable channel 3.1-like n=1 Tax=Tasmannia lanceolata TaxID=3420 RepID=UPI004062D2BB